MIIDNKLLDGLLEQAKVNPRLRQNMDLRTSNDDTSQRMLNAMLRGTQVPIHRHRGTTETVVVLRGSIEEIFYDDNGMEDLLRLQAFREQNMREFHKDILEMENEKRQLVFSPKDGSYDYLFNNTLESGSYSFRINVSGTDPMTGQPVSMTTSRAVLVG